MRRRPSPTPLAPRAAAASGTLRRVSRFLEILPLKRVLTLLHLLLSLPLLVVHLQLHRLLLQPRLLLQRGLLQVKELLSEVLLYPGLRLHQLLVDLVGCPPLLFLSVLPRYPRTLR